MSVTAMFSRIKSRDALFAERLGRDDVRADRHDARAQLRRELVRVGVAAQHDELRASRGRSPSSTIAGSPRVESVDERVLEDRARLRSLRGGGQPERVVQRMQMTAAAVDTGPRSSASSRARLDVGALEKSQLLIAVALLAPRAARAAASSRCRGLIATCICPQCRSQSIACRATRSSMQIAAPRARCPTCVAHSRGRPAARVCSARTRSP